MEIKEDKDFLFATKQARLATFLEMMRKEECLETPFTTLLSGVKDTSI